MTLLKKLFEMCELGLIDFQDEETVDGSKPVGEIKEADLWPKIRVAFGGMSLSDAAMLSRHSKGIAVQPVFGRPHQPEQKIDVFVLMPFKAKMEKVYISHIKKLGEELTVTMRRADEIFSPRPFMEKVWEGICSAQLILADCTEKNPNVFYEVGIAHMPDPANFLQGVVFQGNHDFGAKAAPDVDGVTPVAISIDPFFAKVTEN